MQARSLSILSLLVALSSCKHFPFKDFPIEINALIEGEIKGHRVYCEKKISLGSGKWQVLCGVGNDTDIKYRTQSVTEDKAVVEFLIGKSKESYEKIIAQPIFIVKKDQGPRQVITRTDTANLKVTVERIK